MGRLVNVAGGQACRVMVPSLQEHGVMSCMPSLASGMHLPQAAGGPPWAQPITLPPLLPCPFESMQRRSIY